MIQLTDEQGQALLRLGEAVDDQGDDEKAALDSILDQLRQPSRAPTAESMSLPPVDEAMARAADALVEADGCLTGVAVSGTNAAAHAQIALAWLAYAAIVRSSE